MEFLGASSGAYMATGANSTTIQFGISFGVQGTGAAQFSGAADILKQVEQLMVKANRKKNKQRKNCRSQLIV